MNLLKYHKKIYFPDSEKLKLIIEALNKQSWQYISKHAINELKNERLNLEEIGQFLKGKQFTFEELFEYKKTKEGNIYNLVFRVQYKQYCDIILVVSMNKSLISAWVNSRTDKHFTLNANNYERG